MLEFASVRLPSVVALDPRDAVVVIPLAPLAELVGGVWRSPFVTVGGHVNVPVVPPGAVWFRVPPRFFKGRRHPRPTAHPVDRTVLVATAVPVTDPAAAALVDFWAEARLAGPPASWARGPASLTVYVDRRRVYATIRYGAVLVSVPEWHVD